MARRPGSQNEGVIPHSLQANLRSSLVDGTPYLTILLVLSVAVRGTGKGVRVPGPQPAGPVGQDSHWALSVLGTALVALSILPTML